MKEIICAECGKKITEKYFTYREIHIQRDFFENAKYNIFCSMKCAAEATMLESRLISVHGKPLYK